MPATRTPMVAGVTFPDWHVAENATHLQLLLMASKLSYGK